MRGGRRQRGHLYSLLDFLGLFYRDGRPADSFERLAARLERMGLVDSQEIDQAREDALSLKKRGQIEMYEIQVHLPADLLALCCCGMLAEGERAASELLKLNKDLTFLRLVQAYLFEEAGKPAEALVAIEEGVVAETSPWLKLELARLRIMLGELEDIGAIFLPVAQFDELPPRELAMTIASLARQGGEPVAWELQKLLQRLGNRASADFAVPLAGCQIELVLGRGAQALGSLRAALSMDHQKRSADEQGFLLHMTLQLASAGVTDALLECLEETGLAEEWMPLTHALAFLGKDPQRLQKIAPEMKIFTEVVVGRIKALGSAKAPPWTRALTRAH
jgi:hypothetical protein